jgi:hypothetical protein
MKVASKNEYQRLQSLTNSCQTIKKAITMTSKHLRTFLCLVFTTVFLNPFLHAQGLIFDAAAYDTMPQLPLFGGEKGTWGLPDKCSLKPYCPTPDDQGETNSCVAFACSYGAFTVQKAKENKWTSAVATQNAYSAAYVFNQIGTQKGMSFKDAFNFMTNDGVCRAATFPNANVLKGTKPPQTALNEAKNYKTPPTSKVGKTTQEIKDVLCKGQPVIFGAATESDFRKRYANQDTWQPQTVGEPHAMLIIGYDDKAQMFELMNSYGTKWGSGGFIKLKYADLDKVFKTAYILAPSGSKGSSEAGDLATVDSTQREEIGAFLFKNYVKDANTEGVLTPVPVRYDKARQTYLTHQKYWQTEQVFQLLAAGVPAGKYLYVFSLDPLSKLTVHWPPDARWAETDAQTAAYYAPNFGKTPVSSLILSPETVLTIPAPDKGLRLQNAGEDQLIALIADKNIPDFRQRLDKFKAATGDAQKRLTTVFGDILVPDNQVFYLKDDMTVERIVYPKSGWVVPMVLSVLAR